MTQDTIIKKLHQVRAEFAARFNYDINAMVEFLRTQQAQEKQQIVSFAQSPCAVDNEIEKRAA